MAADPNSDRYLEPWVGQPCTEIIRHQFAWQFLFGSVGGVYVECPWRIIASGRIALCGADDGQRFGLPAPQDAQLEAQELIGNRIIRRTVISEVADLRIEFDNGVALELINNSSGYEAWNASVLGSASLIATGGGGMTIFAGK